MSIVTSHYIYKGGDIFQNHCVHFGIDLKGIPEKRNLHMSNCYLNLLNLVLVTISCNLYHKVLGQWTILQ